MSPSRPEWLRGILKRLPTRFIQFSLVGTTGVVVDLSVYRTLLHFGLLTPLARALAIWVAMTWNFILNRNWTFRQSRDQSPWAQYPRYVSSSLLGALVSWSVSMALSHLAPFFHRHLLLAAMVGILAGTVSNFLLSSRWVFARRSG
jgi:dolichol-phosphate mannosyltransferase